MSRVHTVGHIEILLPSINSLLPSGGYAAGRIRAHANLRVRVATVLRRRLREFRDRRSRRGSRTAAITCEPLVRIAVSAHGCSPPAWVAVEDFLPMPLTGNSQRISSGGSIAVWMGVCERIGLTIPCRLLRQRASSQQISRDVETAHVSAMLRASLVVMAKNIDANDQARSALTPKFVNPRLRSRQAPTHWVGTRSPNRLGRLS